MDLPVPVVEALQNKLASLQNTRKAAEAEIKETVIKLNRSRARFEAANTKYTELLLYMQEHEVPLERERD